MRSQNSNHDMLLKYNPNAERVQVEYKFLALEANEARHGLVDQPFQLLLFQQLHTALPAQILKRA